MALELENDDLFDYVNVRYINRVIPSRFHNTFIKAKLKLMLDSSIVWAMIKECYLCTILIKFIFVSLLVDNDGYTVYIANVIDLIWYWVL